MPGSPWEEKTESILQVDSGRLGLETRGIRSRREGIRERVRGKITGIGDI